MTFTVALIGRPNVGKSTLFNRLVGARQALVDDIPGLTRDRREGEAHLGPLGFQVIDTAGLDDARGEVLEARMRQQTETAVDEADVALLLFDARAGVTPLDEHFANWLRAKDKPVVLVANKCESRAAEPGLLEAYSLGLGEPLAVSAEHGEGLSLLYDALAPFAGEEVGEDEVPANEAEDEDDPNRPLNMAIVGRPNVGKSTLLNRLLGEERVLTGPEPGITRDAIAVPWRWDDGEGGGRDIRLVDTAGLRRKARVTETPEVLSAGDTLRAVRFAEVVVLMLDATQPMEKQDLHIANLVVEEGRACIIVLNKWDLVESRKKVRAELADRLEKSLAQAKGLPIVTLSALTAKGVGGLMPAVLKIHGIWNRRVSTSGLNLWLEDMATRHPPPAVRGRAQRLRYITQVKTRPPTFALFAGRPEALPASYLRYLENGLREAFGLDGVPIRIHARKGKNPYVKDKKK